MGQKCRKGSASSFTWHASSLSGWNWRIHFPDFFTHKLGPSVLLGLSPSPWGVLFSHSLTASYMKAEASKRPRWKLPVLLAARSGIGKPSLSLYSVGHWNHRPAQAWENGGKAPFFAERLVWQYREERTSWQPSWRQLSHHSTSLKILFSVFRGIICICMYVSYPLLDYIFSVGGRGDWFIFVFLVPDLLFHTSQISNAHDLNRIAWQYS